jgi:hypothetical protein
MRRIYGVFPVLFGALLFATSERAEAEDAAAKCRAVSGTFTVTTSTGDGCKSPVGLCGSVEWRGDLRAKSSFVATSSIETVDSAVTSVLVFTGDATVMAKGGTILTKDAIVFRLTGAGDFAEVDTVVGGTGAFSNASGAWRASGTFAGNVGEGHYEGMLCR